VVENSSLGESIGVLHFGLGEIGKALVRGVSCAAQLASVAAVEVRADVVGCTLDEICQAGGPVTIRSTVAEALTGTRAAQVAFHAAGSYLERIEEQITGLLEAGLNVVTTAEELICPQGAAAESAARLGERARANSVTLFPAGVNPGFLMDRLPAYVTSMALAPRAIHVKRLVDLAERRQALRRKMGVGEDLESVNAKLAARRMGHVGLVESVRYVATALGWNIGDVEEALSPVVASATVRRGGETVEPGAVLGLEHRARAVDGSGRSICLELTMRLDTEEALDEISIEAETPLRLRVDGGLNGDRATITSVVNATRFVMDAPPGLQRELPVPLANVY